MDKGFDASQWRAWLDANRGEVAGGTYNPKPGEEVGPGSQGTQIKFFGIPVKSKNVLFIIDRSLSMEWPAAFNEEELHYKSTGGSKDGDSRLKDLEPEGNRRWDIARYQLKKVLLMLPNGTRFNIIFVWSDRMRTLDNKSRDEAIEWVDTAKPHGGTDIWAALSEGMKFCAEKGADGDITREGADTIYLMSDGVPHPPGKAGTARSSCTPSS